MADNKNIPNHDVDEHLIILMEQMFHVIADNNLCPKCAVMGMMEHMMGNVIANEGYEAAVELSSQALVAAKHALSEGRYKQADAMPDSKRKH